MILDTFCTIRSITVYTRTAEEQIVVALLECGVWLVVVAYHPTEDIFSRRREHLVDPQLIIR